MTWKKRKRGKEDQVEGSGVEEGKKLKRWIRGGWNRERNMGRGKIQWAEDELQKWRCGGRQRRQEIKQGGKSLEIQKEAERKNGRGRKGIEKDDKNRVRMRKKGKEEREGKKI